ncbi:MAG: SDR family oxidoreductase [Pirellulaceae bacterium]|nr:SDR family oxidoreductase [Pirellulaceae bacterium]
MTRQPENLMLQGKTALVTGSSQGIGRQIALGLAAVGANVIVHGRSEKRCHEVATTIRSGGQKALVLAKDLAKAKDREELVEDSWQWQGMVDIWVNNAGADVLTGEVAAWPFEKKLQRLWEVDVLSTIFLGRSVGDRMKATHHQTKDAVIINVGWDQADTGMAGDSGAMFGTIKGAIMAFSKSLAKSLAPEVRVNCVAPGWIKTSWGEDASDYWQQRAQKESLVGRWGTPNDVARVVRFLVSPAATFISGQTIAVNGGFRTEGDG